MEDLRTEDPRRIGAYRLLKRLGGGGMGQVFLGRSRGGRLVAVKLVRPELADAPDFRRRFRREVEAARQVGGFYTAQVLDADPDGNPPWLATAYIPGPSLQDAVSRHGSLPEASLGLLAAGLAEGLAAVHGCGVVHRDLKPGNVLLAADGPRLIDFGIARAADDTQLTGSGAVIGTPGFMAPEHIVGNVAEPASDVFALGAVLAYAATGRPPFGSGAAHAVNYRAVHEPPQLSGVPSAYTALIEDCLAKDAAKRPATRQIIDRVPTWGDSGATWLPPRVTTMIDEARATGQPDTNSPGLGFSFFTSDVEIPTPEGWADAGRTEQEQEESRAREQRQKRLARCRRLISGATTVSGSIAATQLRSRALAVVAAAAMPVQPERGRSLAKKAMHLAAEAPQGLDRVTALSHVAQALAGADDKRARKAAEQSVALAEKIRGLFSGGARRDALAVAAVGLAPVAPARAEKIATTLGWPWTLAEVAEAMAAKDPARAERIARAISTPEAAGRALADAAEAMAGTDPERAERMTRELDPDQADRVLLAIVQSHTTTDPERAARIARQLESSIGTFQAEMLTERAAAALARTDPERAVRMVPPGSYCASQIARRVVEEAAATDLARAEHLVRTVPKSVRHSARNQLLGKMAEVDADRAERIARGVSDDDERAEALATVFSSLLHSDFPRAQRVARTIPADQADTRAYVLTCMAESLAPYDTARADGLFSEAEALADGLRGGDDYDYDYAASHLAQCLVRRDPSKAADLARTIGDPETRAHTLSGMAAELVPDLPERAMALFEQAAHAARDISHAALPAYTMAGIIKSAAPHARQWATALAVETVRTDRGAAEKMAEALMDFAPEEAAPIAAGIVRTAREEDDDGDTYNIYGQGGLVLLAEADPRQAARLAVSHGPADGPDAALYELVEKLARQVGQELDLSQP